MYAPIPTIIGNQICIDVYSIGMTEMRVYLFSMGYLNSDIVYGLNMMQVPTTGNITVLELMGDIYAEDITTIVRIYRMFTVLASQPKLH
jgi:hypothetical protein